MPKKSSQLFLSGFIVLCTIILAAFLYFSTDHGTQIKPQGQTGRKLKLYWFIPDGLRADPSIFTIFKWADEGLLPNLKKMMDSGAYGYSVPVFPGHTPVNFATLLTGSTPRVHGIADGPMHIEGYPLKMVSKGGFSSVAKRVPPMWYTLEKHGFLPIILSVPGSTPPELDMGITIRGRWGGWGADFPAIIFHTAKDSSLRQSQGLRNRVFDFGSKLTKFVKATKPVGWRLKLPQSYSPMREIALSNWGTTIYACIYDSTNDGVKNYDKVIFSKDKEHEFTRLVQGQWSPWLPITLTWEMKNDYNIYTPKRMNWERSLSSFPIKTKVAIDVIKLGKPDFFRIQFFYNSLNSYLVKPSYLENDIEAELGPMVDFPDNYPPQLIHYPEDKNTFLEETWRSLRWHKKMAGYMIKRTNSDVIFHDIYTPNQMLTSRWWMGYLDPQGKRYGEIDAAKRQELWAEVKKMYQGIDDILGEILADKDQDTYVVLSSDHGIVPLNQEVRLNNLFASHGLLRYTRNDETGVYDIDWEHTQVIFLKMDNIYINPDGLGGNYYRASGKRYKELRRKVIRLLNGIKDKNGVSPVDKIVPWERVEDELSLPADRVGDLVIANKPTYGWVEDLSPDLKVFHSSLKSGYKQAIIPRETEDMLTPFVIMGPGVKKNYKIKRPIRHIDQYPTIMTLLGQTIPKFVEGHTLTEILQGDK